jgi:hypothetical protein
LFLGPNQNAKDNKVDKRRAYVVKASSCGFQTLHSQEEEETKKAVTVNIIAFHSSFTYVCDVCKSKWSVKIVSFYCETLAVCDR